MVKHRRLYSALAITAISMVGSYAVVSTIPNTHNIAYAKKDKYKSVNKDLATQLKQDQSYAENNPDNFGYSQYIEKIKYEGNTDINVYVNGGFKDLNDDEKTDVLNQVQGIAKMVLLNDNKISDSDAADGLVVEAFNGKNSVAVSAVFNHKAYHFN